MPPLLNTCRICCSFFGPCFYVTSLFLRHHVSTIIFLVPLILVRLNLIPFGPTPSTVSLTSHHTTNTMSFCKDLCSFVSTNHIPSFPFLDATTPLFKWVCPSVRPPFRYSPIREKLEIASFTKGFVWIAVILRLKASGPQYSHLLVMYPALFLLLPRSTPQIVYLSNLTPSQHPPQ